MTILNWSNIGETIRPGKEPVLSVGVRGCALDLPEGIYIPLIRAEVPGDGRVGQFLDSLPRDRRVVFPTVISGKLAGMLTRRGFVDAYESGEEVMERGPVKS